MGQVLSEVSEALADSVASAGTGVVRVEGRGRLPASGIVWSADGVILTAHHVLERDEEINVGLEDGQTVPATLVGRDPTTDLALVRAKVEGLPRPEWKEPNAFRVGNLALALGRPGRTVQATLGVVSALGNSWRTRAGGHIDRYLQSDVTMYPGFSGGPLVDASGAVLGLNTSALLRGVSVSIPLPTVRAVSETLLAHGRVRRGYLGVGAQVVRLPKAAAAELGQETGLLLNSVAEGSPAEKGGLLLGDTLVGLDGQPVRHMDDLFALLSAELIGRKVPARIVRGGHTAEQDVTVGERN